MCFINQKQLTHGVTIICFIIERQYFSNSLRQCILLIDILRKYLFVLRKGLFISSINNYRSNLKYKTRKTTPCNIPDKIMPAVT